MAITRDIQTSFTAGVLGPGLRGRVDIEAYYSGMLQADNVVCLPQGGITRREGTRQLAKMSPTHSNNYTLYNFRFNEDQQYMMVFIDAVMYVYYKETLTATIRLTPIETLTFSWNEVSIISQADSILLFHESFNPVIVQRSGTHSAWNVSNVQLTNIPKHRFAALTITAQGDITPSDKSGSITITSTAAEFDRLRVGQFITGLNDVPGLARITRYVSDTVVDAIVITPFFSTDSIPAVNWQIDAGYVDSWSTSRGWPKTATFHEGRLWFGGSRDLPTRIWGSKLGSYFNFDIGTGIASDAIVAQQIVTDGVNRIVAIKSETELQIFTSAGEFFIPQPTREAITPTNISIVSAGTNKGALPFLPVISLDKGTLFIQAHGKQLCSLEYVGSEVSYNIANTSAVSGSLFVGPIGMALRRAAGNDEGDRLLILNSDGTMVVYTMFVDQEVIAPTRFTTYGEFKAVAVLGQYIYVMVRRNGATYLEIFDELSLLDSSLNVPRYDTTSVANSATGQSDKVFILSDGVPIGPLPKSSAGVYSHGSLTNGVLPQAQLATRIPDSNQTMILSDISGKVVTATVDPQSASNIFFTENDIGKVILAAAHLTATPSNNTDGIGIITSVRGNTITMRVEGSFPATNLGTNWALHDGFKGAYVGVDFPVVVETMPYESKSSQPRSSMSRKKRIVKVGLLLLNTSNIVVQGERAIFREFGSLPATTKFGMVPKTEPENLEIGSFLGYSNIATVEITQDSPEPMTVLALEYSVSIGNGR